MLPFLMWLLYYCARNCNFAFEINCAFRFSQGKMKLFGTIIFPKNRYLTLQFSRGGKNVMCEDNFDTMVSVFVMFNYGYLISVIVRWINLWPLKDSFHVHQCIQVLNFLFHKIRDSNSEIMNVDYICYHLDTSCVFKWSCFLTSLLKCNNSVILLRLTSLSLSKF